MYIINPAHKLGNHILSDGGEMGAIVRSFYWKSTSIGAPEICSQSLFTVLNMLVNAKFPMLLRWGQNHVQFYNDAYRPNFGVAGKHPATLGQEGKECWKEIWQDVEPLIQKVYGDGESIWRKNQPFKIVRNNAIECAYFTFSYSAIRDDNGRTGGVL